MTLQRSFELTVDGAAKFKRHQHKLYNTMQPVNFWIEYGSTYTYLSVARIGRLAAEAEVEIRWQPFFLMPIMAELGLNQGPFLPYPGKTAYMWRDIERRARRHAVPYVRPANYPVDSLLTARIACIATEGGWCQAFTEAVFALHWTQDVSIGTEKNIGTALSALGKPLEEVLMRARTLQAKDRLRQQTEQAKSLGIFGAPSFTVGTELFWGDDRLEEAIDWARTH